MAMFCNSGVSAPKFVHHTSKIQNKLEKIKITKSVNVYNSNTKKNK